MPAVIFARLIALIQKYLIDLILLAVAVVCFGLAKLLYDVKEKEEQNEKSFGFRDTRKKRINDTDPAE